MFNDVLWQRWHAALSDYKVWASEGVVWAGIAFMIGFLLKNIGKYLFGALVAISAALLVLSHVGVVVVHVDSFLAMIGLQSVHNWQDFQQLLQDVMTYHIVAVLGATCGFVIGWKIG